MYTRRTYTMHHSYTHIYIHTYIDTCTHILRIMKKILKNTSRKISFFFGLSKFAVYIASSLTIV